MDFRRIRSHYNIIRILRISSESVESPKSSQNFYHPENLVSKETWFILLKRLFKIKYDLPKLPQRIYVKTDDSKTIGKSKRSRKKKQDTSKQTKSFERGRRRRITPQQLRPSSPPSLNFYHHECTTNWQPEKETLRRRIRRDRTKVYCFPYQQQQQQ